MDRRSTWSLRKDPPNPRDFVRTEIVKLGGSLILIATFSRRAFVKGFQTALCAIAETHAFPEVLLISSLKLVFNDHPIPVPVLSDKIVLKVACEELSLRLGKLDPDSLGEQVQVPKNADPNSASMGKLGAKHPVEF